jgi:hypothetical protein
VHPEAAEWGPVEHLLAGIFDLLQAGNWQRGGDPRAPRPKPLPRPGVDSGEKKYGGKPLPMDEMARRLGWEVTP